MLLAVGSARYRVITEAKDGDTGKKIRVLGSFTSLDAERFWQRWERPLELLVLLALPRRQIESLNQSAPMRQGLCWALFGRLAECA